MPACISQSSFALRRTGCIRPVTSWFARLAHTTAQLSYFPKNYHRQLVARMCSSPRVLSIQSHVVFGYVGNKSATFPLQCLGFDVDVINSVQLCNHTGYKLTRGQVLSHADLGILIEGLRKNNLDNAFTHLLTGYIGSAHFLDRIGSLVDDLKNLNPDLLFVCDPVLGDNGKMYVPNELLPIYKDVIVPMADILTPNQFEAEKLTERKIETVRDAWNAIDHLHHKGCKTVVISSTNLGRNGNLLAFASTTVGEKRRVTMEIPKLAESFTGSGDLFTALFLAWLYKTSDLGTALENTIATIQAVLKRTLTYANQVGVSPKSLELKLIQSKRDIEEPCVEVRLTTDIRDGCEITSNSS